MSNLIDHAKRELALLTKGEEKDKMQTLIEKNILELLEVFDNQNHSGFSASYALGLFNKLANFKPLAPLTGEDDEWVEVSQGLYQNNRLHSVFKENGKAYKYDHYVFEDEDGDYYTNIESRKEIEFPYLLEEQEIIKRNPIEE